MLRLREQVGGHVHGVGGPVCDDHHFGRSGRQVDAALAEDLELGGRDPGVARTDDAVDRGDTRVGQSVGHRPDGLGAARDDEGVHSNQSGRSQQRLVDRAFGIRGRGDDDRADAGHFGRNHAHQQRAWIGGRAARGVDAGARQGHPTSLDLHARHDRGRSGLGQLGHGEAADVLDHLLEPGPDPRRQRLARGFHLRLADKQRAVGPTAAETGVGGADGRVAAGLDRGQDRPRAFADSLVRDDATPHESLDLRRDGRIYGRARQLEAAQVDGRAAHETSFSIGRIRMPEAPAALRRGSSDQTASASTTE